MCEYASTSHTSEYYTAVNVSQNNTRNSCRNDTRNTQDISLGKVKANVYVYSALS